MSLQVRNKGDFFKELRKIYDSLPESADQREMLRELARGLADLDGEWPNLLAYWPDL